MWITAQEVIAIVKKEVRKVLCKCNDRFNNLPSYADNDAAIAGGLVDGDFYQTGGVVKVVYQL